MHRQESTIAQSCLYYYAYYKPRSTSSHVFCPFLQSEKLPDSSSTTWRLSFCSLISLGVSSPRLLEKLTNVRVLSTGLVKMQDLKDSPVSLLAKEPTCIGPWDFAKEIRDHEFLIPCITEAVLTIIVNPSQDCWHLWECLTCCTTKLNDSSGTANPLGARDRKPLYLSKL